MKAQDQPKQWRRRSMPDIIKNKMRARKQAKKRLSILGFKKNRMKAQDWRRQSTLEIHKKRKASEETAKASKEAAKDSGLRKIQNEATRPSQAMAGEKHAGYNKKQDEGAKASEKRPEDDDDHSAVIGSGSNEDDGSGNDLVEIDLNDPEYEDSDDQEEFKKKFASEAMGYLSKLRLETQKSVHQFSLSKNNNSPEVTIPLSLIIIFSRWTRQFPLHFHEDLVHCLSVVSNLVGLTPIKVLEAYCLRYEPTASLL
jgi:hypothetical protein